MVLVWKKLVKNIEKAVWNGDFANATTPGEMTDLLKKICNDSFKKVHPDKGKKRSKYWWTEDIKTKRLQCQKLRRQMTRSNTKYLKQENMQERMR